MWNGGGRLHKEIHAPDDQPYDKGILRNVRLRGLWTGLQSVWRFIQPGPEARRPAMWNPSLAGDADQNVSLHFQMNIARHSKLLFTKTNLYLLLINHLLVLM